MTACLDLIRSAMSGVAWPALPSGPGATALALQYQLDESQWWSAAMLGEAQSRQLALVLRHAHDTMPFWRERLAACGYRPGIDVPIEWLSRLPLLTRAEAQQLGEALLCGAVPTEHGRVYRSQTSGSTGRPLGYWGTEITQLHWRAFTLRDHLWHRRDLGGTLAAIRNNVELGSGMGWGPATDVAFRTGRCVTLHIRTDIDAQIEWLREARPDYLISNAHNVYGLARRCIERGIALPGLREARSFGASFPEDMREVVRRAWGAKLADVYTAEEVGYIALQCPDHEHYHAQAENLVIEVLREDGAACAPGEIGRVVLTTLHNFAMPLLRYDIGDYAEAGAPCPCGRGLPVLNRILGRQRNILLLPDGRRRWPSFPSKKWGHIAPITQIQIVQRSLERVDAKVVAARDLSPGERDALTAALQDCLGYPFQMAIERVAEIPRSANYKFEDFVSEIA